MKSQSKEDITKRASPQKIGILRRFSNKITSGLETGFYKMGKIKIKKVPRYTIWRPKRKGEREKFLKFFSSDLELGTTVKRETLADDKFSEVQSEQSEIISYHDERKSKEVETWRNIHLPMIHAAVEAECPPSICTVCNIDTINIVKCRDCGPQKYFCEVCAVNIHEKVLFHFPQIWQAEQQSFHLMNKITSLVVVRCHCQLHYEKEIVVVDPQGRQHQVQATFCKCQSEAVSLVAAKLWPASPSKPKVAFSFAFLDRIEAIMMECQASLRGLCEAVKWENMKQAFPVYITNLYKVLTGETYEQFRHFKYKRTTGQDVMPNIINGTECPVCPSQHEGKGTSIYSLDGNFGLVRRKKAGKSVKEPNHQNLLFLDQEKVDLFVNGYTGKSNKGCSNFQAGSDVGAKTKNPKLEETAIFGAACRHEFPMMFCSLKFGERLSYPIFLIMNILEQLPSEKTVVLYDIACTLHTHIKKNNDLQHLAEKIAFGIPVFHCHGHRFQCQVLYNPRKMESVGLTDGETMERLWSFLRKFKKMTKEMSADHRVDLLTDALLHYAAKLRLKLATTLCDKFKRATHSKIQFEDDLHTQLKKVSATLSDVSMWSKQQEETAQANTSYTRKKISCEDWKEDYGFKLTQLQFLSRRKESCEATETEKVQLQIAQLSIQVAEIEKKQKMKRRWSNDQAYPYYCNAVKRKQEVIVAQLQKLALERQSYIESIKKYAGSTIDRRRIGCTETTDPDKLWVPLNAEILDHRHQVEKVFPPAPRFAWISIVGDNVLSSQSIRIALTLYEKIQNATSSGGHTLDDVCSMIGPWCNAQSIPGLWMYNRAEIDSLTDLDIIHKINSGSNIYNPLPLLGDRTVDPVSGNITGAGAMNMRWLLKGDEDIKSKVEDFELTIIDIAQEGLPNLETFVFTSRSFSDEGGGAITGDVVYLSAGYFILIIFVILVLGRFNSVEQRVGLALSGILCIGLSILVSFGLASAVGAEYGPLHSVLPFLLLGIGVDDMFVIVGALNSLTTEESDVDIPEKVGRVLRHAGVSITVTSLTDIVAFAIGASTILPALRSFCIFAAFGILGLYVTQTVFFTACLALDLRRQDGMRDGCCCCYQHKHWHPNSCSKVELIPLFFKKVLGPLLAKLPVKIVVIVVTLGVLAANIYGLINLKQNFDPNWFLPSDGYGSKYFQTQEKYFPDDGAGASVYCFDMNYYENRDKLTQLYDKLTTSEYIANGTTDSWYHDFIADGRSPGSNETEFNENVYMWANSTNGGTPLRRFVFGADGTDILGSQIEFKHIDYPDSAAEVKAMDAVKKMVTDILPDCFAYSRFYQTWETNKVIQLELYRNIGLAFACVFVVTLVLIANFLTSILVFTCVTFTLVNVGGCMYFWGLTIDTVTSIILILAIGLAVDYSAHIGHKFMTIKGNRHDRMLETLWEMGPPVFNGGFSTFLAFVLLAGSNSYVFTTFFQVFLLVVCYGLYHGMIYLPVILSWIGPAPYLTADHEYAPNDTEMDPADKMGYTNNGAINIGTTPKEPEPDYDQPANGHVQNGVHIGLGSNGNVPPPDYSNTPPTGHASFPRVST